MWNVSEDEPTSEGWNSPLVDATSPVPIASNTFPMVSKEWDVSHLDELRPFASNYPIGPEIVEAAMRFLVHAVSQDVSYVMCTVTDEGQMEHAELLDRGSERILLPIYHQGTESWALGFIDQTQNGAMLIEPYHDGNPDIRSVEYLEYMDLTTLEVHIWPSHSSFESPYRSAIFIISAAFALCTVCDVIPLDIPWDLWHMVLAAVTRTSETPLEGLGQSHFEEGEDRRVSVQNTRAWIAEAPEAVFENDALSTEAVEATRDILIRVVKSIKVSCLRDAETLAGRKFQSLGEVSAFAQMLGEAQDNGAEYRQAVAQFAIVRTVERLARWFSRESVIRHVGS
jgi:hypothetical protein